MSLSDWLATLGVGLLLIAFLLNLFKKIRPENWLYGTLNAVGAGLCGYAAYLIGFYPFVVLEGVWMAVSLISLVKNVPHGTR